MIRLEGFHSEPHDDVRPLPAAEHSRDHSSLPGHPNATWLSQVWNSYKPSSDRAGSALMSSLASLCSLKTWLTSEIDYTYGSLV